MGTSYTLFLTILVSISCFGQSKVEKKIIDEGMRLYRIEMASWYGTDILVEFSQPIGWEFFSLEKYLEQYFGIKVDLVTTNALKERPKDRILKQVRYVWSRNTDNYAPWKWENYIPYQMKKQ